MKLEDLKPPAPPPEPPAWQRQLREFWLLAPDQQRIDMQVTMKMGDRAGAKQILENWQQSLVEKRRRKSRRKKSASQRPFRYGAYGGWFYPGFHNDSGADSTADGGGDGGGGESLRESESLESTIQRFVAHCCDFLKIDQAPRIRLRRDPAWSERQGTFGRYSPDHHHIELATHGRHIQDILRTLAHEMTHARQDETVGLPDDAGETGSTYEDEANALAGQIMRHWADQEPDLFSVTNTGADRVMPEDYSPDDPPGPEFRPTMPKGTVRVDVSDMYDWYKLGQHISDLEGLGRHDFGKGPPSTILAFGDEDLEHEYIQNLKRTGLDVTDIDPSEHQPMKGQKTDPTYNVAEASGYIPTNAEKNDPRFSMALTRDIRPGETGRQANKLALKTDSQGRPGLLMKKLNNLLEEVKLDEKCWDGYRQQGMKRKGDRMVPNCVPVSETPSDEIFRIVKTPVLQAGDRVWIEDFQKYGKIRELSQDRARVWIDGREHIFPISKLRKASAVMREDEELTEVKMSPAEFQKFLKSPEAEGIRAGFEAELIFRDTQSDPDGSGESEPDWDMDERAYSIDDIIDFFTSADNGIGPGSARRLQDQLMDSFSDYAQQQFEDDYFDLARFQEWADDNVWPEVDDQYRDQARDNLDDPDASDEDIEKEAVTLFHDDVERDWDRSGEWYDRAREELYDEYWGDLDQGDWLDQAGLRFMSNVSEEYGLDWPYWTDGSGSGGTRDWQEIANSLERVTGMPVRVSSGYHGAARRPGQYIIEPDSSLDADGSDDYGLEVVSPPLPLPEAVEQLRRIIDWANGPGDAYTNSSTGLHMGVSLPYKGGDVDPVKLILFMGDKNLLELFGRESNTYARSAYERLESKIRGLKNAGPKQISGIMDLMKNNLIELAERDLQRNLIGDKYVSVHPQDGYIEFRGPGGDYLSKEDEIDGVLENTMLRLAYAMSIAGDNSAYRNEYAKKLYKVLTAGDRDNPFMRLFADYSAGTLTGEELKRQWADTVLAAERPDVEDTEDVPTGTAQEYEVYDRNTGEIYTTFRARNDDEAVEQFSQHYRAAYAQRGLPVLRVKGPVQREYEVVDRRTGTPGDQDSYKVIDTFSAANDTEAAEMAMNKWAGQGIDFVVRKKAREEPKSQKPKSRRAELAKRVTRSTRDVGEQLWRVNHHSSQRWVVARSQAEAVAKAVQQDRMFDSPETRARIATDLERQQWQQDQEARALRQRDSEQDAAQIRARLGAPQAAGGEFTGAWEIRDGQGRELHRFGGIGNSQADANRFAARWLGMFRPDLAGQEVDVVPVMRQGVAEGLNETQTVTRIDSKPITGFASQLKAYKHTDDWSQSGIDTGDDSYWRKNNLQVQTTKGLFAGDPKRTALYATGNAHETRYVEFTQDGKSYVYFDAKDVPKFKNRKTYLSVFDAKNFRKLPTGEYFSDNPGEPIKQTEITNPFEYIKQQGWNVRVTNDLNKVFKQVKDMHKKGKIPYYGGEGMSESRQAVQEGGRR